MFLLEMDRPSALVWKLDEPKRATPQQPFVQVFPCTKLRVIPSSDPAWTNPMRPWRWTVHLRSFSGVPFEGMHVPLAPLQWSTLHVRMVVTKNMRGRDCAMTAQTPHCAPHLSDILLLCHSVPSLEAARFGPPSGGPCLPTAARRPGKLSSGKEIRVLLSGQ